MIVTVNTDDVLVFGNGVSEEFLGLYQARVFTADELDAVRRAGIERRLATVIARSAATKQASLSADADAAFFSLRATRALDCFASLALTPWAPLRPRE